MKLNAYVITLAPESERFKRFSQLNKHLDWTIFNAIRGENISINDRLNKGYVTEEAALSGLVTDGSLGCALSHYTLWQEVAASGAGALIMEDDVVTHRKISKYIIRSSDLESKDILFFGCNTDSIMGVISPQGVRHVTAFKEKNPSYDEIISILSKTKISRVTCWRYLKGFGLCCYFITPNGANKLIQMLFPLRLEGVLIPYVSSNVPGISPDRRLNALYENIWSYITIPFLALTPNTDSATSN